MALYKILWFKPEQKLGYLMSGDDELGGFLGIPAIYHPLDPLPNTKLDRVLPL